MSSVLKRFRNKVARARILSTVRKRRHFVSGSEKRRAARRKGIQRARKRQRSLQQKFRRA